MRDNYIERMGLLRAPLAHRGFVATVWALGDVITMRAHELDAIFPPGWPEVANDLCARGFIGLEIDNNRYTITIKYPNLRRRKQVKEAMARQRKKEDK